MSKRAFTLTELLVVITIIVILLGIAIPAFRSMQDSSERMLAENQLRVSLLNARDSAVRAAGTFGGSGAGDSAAAFFFEPGGKTRVVVYVYAGQIVDRLDPDVAPTLRANQIVRDVFVPATDMEPVELPSGWMVRGLAAANTVDGVAATGARTGWYYPSEETRFDAQEVNWVFPESGLVDPTSEAVGNRRSTFVVRYEAGTGAVSMNRNQVLLFDPSVARSALAASNPLIGQYDLTRAENLKASVARILGSMSDPNLTLTGKQELLGSGSPDTVLAGPVSVVALYEERVMAAGVGASGVNPVTKTVYGNASDPRSEPTVPAYDPTLFSGGSVQPGVVTKRINAWMTGDRARMSAAGVATPGRSEARLFAIRRYSGQLQEVTP